ncbi:MAG: DnaD domain protein [Bacteroides sp.]
MPKASGEFVKIYLYILRCLSGNAVIDNCTTYKNGCTSYSNSSDCFCVSFLADKLNITENDVMRALKYWENEGLLILTYASDDSGSKELSGITVVSDPAAANDNINIKKKPSYTSAQLKKFAANEELGQLLYIAQKYIGKPLSSTETNSMIFLYDTLKMPPDMIEYLLEYCISKGHKNMRYMEKVAMDWVEKGLTTVDEAKQYSSGQANEVFAVLNAFGITGRGVAKVERDYIRKWNDTYCFSPEIIVEACNRTIQAIHQPSFEYADTILTKWNERGIKNLDDIKALDDEFDKTRKATVKSSVRLTVAGQGNKARTSGSNKFNNFSQRDYDYDELEKSFVSKGLV